MSAAPAATTTTTTTTTRKRTRRQLQQEEASEKEADVTLNDAEDSAGVDATLPAAKRVKFAARYIYSLDVFADGSVRVELVGDEGDTLPQQSFDHYSEAYLYLHRNQVPFFASLYAFQTSAMACFKKLVTSWSDKNAEPVKLRMALHHSDSDLATKEREYKLIFKMLHYPIAPAPPPPGANRTATTATAAVPASDPPPAKPIQLTFNVPYDKVKNMWKHDPDRHKLKFSF